MKLFPNINKTNAIRLNYKCQLFGKQSLTYNLGRKILIIIRNPTLTAAICFGFVTF